MSAMPITLVVKLASIVVHLNEANSAGGHRFDAAAAHALANDQEVQAWLAGIDPVLLPLKRHP